MILQEVDSKSKMGSPNPGTKASFNSCYEGVRLTEKFSQEPPYFFVPLVSGRYQATYRDSGLVTDWRNQKKTLLPSVRNSSTSFGIMMARSNRFDDI